MTKEETVKLLMVLEATFPNFEVKEPQATMEAWHLFLEEYDYKAVTGAVKIYVSTQGTAFAPSVSQIIAMTRKPAELAQMDTVTAWGQVRKAISRGIYYSEEEFEKLSPEVQKAVGNPARIREWAQMPSDTIDSVIHSEFRRSFETMQKRELEVQALPAEIRAQISAATQKNDNRIIYT